MSWKTTIASALLAGLMIAQEAFKDGIQWNDPQLWVACSIAVIGFLAKDSDRGAAPVVALLACLTLTGCESMNVTGSLAYMDPETGAKAGMTVTDNRGGWWVRLPIPAKAGEGVVVVEGDLPSEAPKVIPEK